MLDSRQPAGKPARPRNGGQGICTLGRYSEAVEVADESTRIEYFHTAVRVLAASYAQLGMFGKARAAVNELVARGKGDTNIAEVIAPFLS
jgi:adenylate cyclase